MSEDDFSFTDEKGNVEASLDDFFQPVAKETPKKGDESKYYPVDKSKPLLEQIPPEIGVPKTEPKEEAPLEKKPPVGKLLIALLVIVMVLVLGAGGYYAYISFFQKKEPQVVVKPQPPAPKPVVSAPAPAPSPESAPPTLATPSASLPAQASPATQPSSTAKPSEVSQIVTPIVPAEKEKQLVPPTKPMEPSGQPAPSPLVSKPPVETAQPKPLTPSTPASTTVQKKPSQAPSTALPAPPSPKQVPALEQTPKPESMPASSKKVASLQPQGRYTIQVGSYMLEESKIQPEAKLASIGITDYHYVDINKKIGVYHLYLKGTFSEQEANQKKNSLEQLGFKPRVEPLEEGRYRVWVYSYGTKKVANDAKAKVENAQVASCEIKYEYKDVVLHQLRVGGFVSQEDAKGTMSTLRKAGFNPVLVKE